MRDEASQLPESANLAHPFLGVNQELGTGVEASFASGVGGMSRTGIQMGASAS